MTAHDKKNSGLTMKEVRDSVKRITKQEELKTTMRLKGRSMRELEQAVERVHVTSFSLDNEVKVVADVYSDTKAWEYTIKIRYKVNGKRRSPRIAISMAEVESSDDINKAIQTALAQDLAKLISVETFDQNKTAIAAATKEFVG